MGEATGSWWGQVWSRPGGHKREWVGVQQPHWAASGCLACPPRPLSAGVPWALALVPSLPRWPRSGSGLCSLSGTVSPSWVPLPAPQGL